MHREAMCTLFTCIRERYFDEAVYQWLARKVDAAEILFAFIERTYFIPHVGYEYFGRFTCFSVNQSLSISIFKVTLD